MKKLLSILVLTLFALCASAQPSRWDAPLDSLMAKSAKAFKVNDYKGVVSLYAQFEKLADELPDSVLTRYKHDYRMHAFPNGDFYYNYACALSMTGCSDAALAKMERYADIVIGHEEIDMPHISKDSDLDPIRSDARFVAVVERLAKWGDYKHILKDAAPYVRSERDSLPAFTYADPNNSDLARLRERFNLDSVMGEGRELSRIKNLLLWVHNTVRHDGSSYNPTSRNTIDMIELCQREGRGVNCRMLATILNECYLAMGFKSRFVTCMPKTMVGDCHVINVVYSSTLDKWVWVDPTFNAYVTDENGVMLSIAEVRERLRSGGELQLNDDANWNNRMKQTKQDYLDRYMSKNLYYVVCPSRSEFNTETPYEGKIPVEYVALVPPGYTEAAAGYVTSDDARFWQSPYEATDAETPSR